MIFFTRELHEGFQDESGWTRSASEKYTRNYKLYKKYFRLIRPFLPSSSIRVRERIVNTSQVIYGSQAYEESQACQKTIWRGHYITDNP
jgi:hypothetical protein